MFRVQDGVERLAGDQSFEDHLHAEQIAVERQRAIHIGHSDDKVAKRNVSQKGTNGNISEDPLFKDVNSFRLRSDSPCINAGDSLLIDRDGTHSDMGIYGGPLGEFD